jgi:hypothetical protein
LSISNSLGWKNPFQQSNDLLYPSLQVSEKTLIAARVQLQAAGLLRFELGHKRHPTTYRLAPHDELFSQENTLGTTAPNIPPIEELTVVGSASQPPLSLETTSSSLNETVPRVKNKTVRSNERASTWPGLGSSSGSSSFYPTKSSEPESESEVDADHGPLGNSLLFQDLARQIGYPQIDFETYRFQMLAKARDKILRMSPQNWRNWIMSYLNRESKSGILLLAPAPNQHRPQHGIGDILAKANFQAPVL